MGEQALGEFLVANGLLSADGLRRGLEAQRALECRLGTVLLDLGLMTEGSLLRALGRFCSARTVSALELADIAPEVVQIVPERFALRHQVVPFRLVGKTLSVAAIDPRDLLLEDELGMLTGCRIASFVAVEVRLDQALARYYGKQLPVQMASLLRRLPAAAAAGATPANGERDNGGRVAEVEGLTELAADRQRSQAAAPARRRPGVPAAREPDETVVVVVSQDELDDFPSLARALDDSGTSRISAPPVASVAAPAPSQPAGAGPRPREGTAPATARERERVDTSPVDPVAARLDAAAEAMQAAEMREDVADAMLGFCAPYLRRRLLLAVREGAVMGWRGEGDNIDVLWVRSMSLSLDEPSVFVGRDEPWVGPLQPTPGNQELLLALGGEAPSSCVILPLTVRTRQIGFLYGDNLRDGLERVPLVELRRLAIKASLALEVVMLRNKIRTT